MISFKKVSLYLLILPTVICHAYADDVHNFDTESIMEIKSQNIYPEGIAWSEKEQKLFISSVTEGTVRSMNKYGELKNSSATIVSLPLLDY